MLPPELFPLIASFIPLRSAPYTLRALALGSRRFYNIVHPILYSRIILRNEDDAVTVIQQILDEPRLGLAVTELHIMSHLSAETRKGQKPFDVVAGIQMLVKKQLVPRLTALGIYLLRGWVEDSPRRAALLGPILLGRLPAEFWRTLRNECPRLRTLILRNVGHSSDNPWLYGDVIHAISCIPGLAVLRLEWKGEGLTPKDNLKILHSLPRLTTSLHTLSLQGQGNNITLLLSLDFPHLKWLCWDRFEFDHDTSKVMAFCMRHPQLESLSILDWEYEWFSYDIEEDFLPNLKHLKATFDEIRCLVPILPQLVSLSFTRSFNGQVPYLLREVLPEGLPQLKSLEITQEATDWEDGGREGVLWYETLEGGFCIETRRRNVERDFREGYMHSIVRGAPNLEELGLQGMLLTSESLHTLSPILSQLVKMERLYYNGMTPEYDRFSPKAREEITAGFVSSAEALARMCVRLTTVTGFGEKCLPYVTARIERDSTGNVAQVRASDGVGMLVSADENDAFPSNNYNPWWS